MSKNRYPDSHNTSLSGMFGNALIRYAAPLGAFAMLLSPMQSANAAPEYTPVTACSNTAADVDWGGSWVNGWLPVLTVDPQNIDPKITVGQLLGTDGKARQEADWAKIRKVVTCQMLGVSAVQSGATFEVVADVGVPQGSSADVDMRAGLQAAELTDVAAGELTMQRGGGPAEAYHTYDLRNMVLFITANRPGDADPVDFNQALRPYPVSQNERMAGYAPEW
ncbi:MAG TPA: hypothetical protein VLG47_07710 [Candidatus Saccharimonadales bacterium]|nr:hypothetical protein [Candidatus Saccharimonadales bacterium]